MRACFLLAVVVAVLVAVPSCVSAQTQGAPTAWNPSQTYPGDAQYDPRLDRPVRLWGAGMPVGKALEQITTQTGVSVAVWPAGDLNERICLSLFLNPQSPPALRDVLAQLAWVIGTSIGVSGKGEARRYFVLSSGRGAWRNTQQIAEQWEAEELRRAVETLTAARPKLFARLQELRPYLGRSREEAARLLQGKDDTFLLALADPKRRAQAAFLLSLSPSDAGEAQSQSTISRKLSSFSAEQQAFLREGLPLDKWARWQERRPTPDVHWEDWAWVRQTDPNVLIGTGSANGFQVTVTTGAEGELRPKPGDALSLPFLQLLPDTALEGQPDPGLAVELRLALGGTVSQEEEAKAFEEGQRLRQLHERRRALPAQPGWRPVLSAAAEEQLTALVLDLPTEGPYALWQMQELVAARSGRHVVSDCFTQDPRSLREGLEVAYPRTSGLTALMALKILALEKATEEGAVPWGRYGWEWGDAGSFLRFRQAAREAQRASFLPAEALAAVASWVDPHLPPEGELAKLPPIDVPLDPKSVIWLSNYLTREQRGAGLYLVYGDPTDPKEAYRRHLRAFCAEAVSFCAGPYQLLGSLSPLEWEKAMGTGLVWGLDFSPKPTELEGESGWWRERQKGDVLRIGPPGDDIAKLVEEKLGTREVLLAQVLREGQLIADPVPLFTRLHLAPQVRPHLVP